MPILLIDICEIKYKQTYIYKETNKNGFVLIFYLPITIIIIIINQNQSKKLK